MATQWTAGLTDNTTLPAATLNQIGAAWETWTPTVTQTGNVTFATNSARYAQIQKVVVAQCYLTVTGAGTANSVVTVSLPITAITSDIVVGGSGFIYDASAASLYTVIGTLPSSTTMSFYYTNASGNFWGQSPNVGLAINDQIRILFTYEGT